MDAGDVVELHILDMSGRDIYREIVVDLVSWAHCSLKMQIEWRTSTISRCQKRLEQCGSGLRWSVSRMEKMCRVGVLHPS